MILIRADRAIQCYKIYTEYNLMSGVGNCMTLAAKINQSQVALLAGNFLASPIIWTEKIGDGKNLILIKNN